MRFAQRCSNLFGRTASLITVGDGAVPFLTTCVRSSRASRASRACLRRVRASRACRWSFPRFSNGAAGHAQLCGDRRGRLRLPPLRRSLGSVGRLSLCFDRRFLRLRLGLLHHILRTAWAVPPSSDDLQEHSEYSHLKCCRPTAVPCRAVPCRAVPCRAVPCRAVPTLACALHSPLVSQCDCAKAGAPFGSERAHTRGAGRRAEGTAWPGQTFFILFVSARKSCNMPNSSSYIHRNTARRAATQQSVLHHSTTCAATHRLGLLLRLAEELAQLLELALPRQSRAVPPQHHSTRTVPMQQYLRFLVLLVKLGEQRDTVRVERFHLRRHRRHSLGGCRAPNCLESAVGACGVPRR